MRRPRLRATAASLALLAAASVLHAGPGVGTAAAEETNLPGTLSSRAENLSVVAVPVPDGVRPRRVDAVLNVERAEGTVELLVNGAVAATVPAALWKRVSVPVGRGDVRADGTVELGVRHVVDECLPLEPVEATLRKLRLVHTGTPTAPTGPADFLPAASSRIDVLVPPAADDAMLGAGLAAVAALTRRYPEGTTVVLGSTKERVPVVGGGQRVLRLQAGRGAVRTELGSRGPVPMLSVLGPGARLAEATEALVGSAPRPGSARPADLPAPGDHAPRSLEDLALLTPPLQGWGRSSLVLPVDQASLGGPVDRLDVHLVAAHTAVPADVTASVEVLVGRTLLASGPLGSGSSVELDVSAPAELLTARNELTVQLTAVPADGSCPPAGATLPLELRVDPARTTVTGAPGAGATTGFGRFPQALQGELPVALGSPRETRLASASDAAAVLARLQRAAPVPLDVSLVSPDELVHGTGPGLLASATDEQALALGAPVRYDGSRRVAGTDTRIGMSPDAPFAALQAVAGDRGLLVLGGHGPPEQVARLAGKVATRASLRWTTLTGDLLVAERGAAVTTVTSGATGASASGMREEEQVSYAKWFLLAVALLLLALAVQLVVTIRRDRRQRSAQTPVEATAGGLSGPARRP